MKSPIWGTKNRLRRRRQKQPGHRSRCRLAKMAHDGRVGLVGLLAGDLLLADGPQQAWEDQARSWQGDRFQPFQQRVFRSETGDVVELTQHARGTRMQPWPARAMGFYIRVEPDR